MTISILHEIVIGGIIVIQSLIIHIYIYRQNRFSLTHPHSEQQYSKDGGFFITRSNKKRKKQKMVLGFDNHFFQFFEQGSLMSKTTGSL